MKSQAHEDALVRRRQRRRPAHVPGARGQDRRPELCARGPHSIAFALFRTRITACCYPDRVETGPHFVPGLPHVPARLSQASIRLKHLRDGMEDNVSASRHCYAYLARTPLAHAPFTRSTSASAASRRTTPPPDSQHTRATPLSSRARAASQSHQCHPDKTSQNTRKSAGRTD